MKVPIAGASGADAVFHRGAFRGRMRAVRLLALALLLPVAGCASYEGPGAPPPGGASGGGGGNGTASPSSAEGGVRVALRGHEVEGSTVTLRLDVANEGGVVANLTYALLGFEASESTLYFDVFHALGPGATGHYEVESNDTHGLARGSWADLTLHYQVPVGGGFLNDRAAELDLRGRGLPSNVS